MFRRRGRRWAKSPVNIATIPGRGYRFVADVRQSGAVETELTTDLTIERRTTAELVVEEEFGEDPKVPAHGRLPATKTILVLSVLLAAGLGAAGWRIWVAGPAPDVTATRSIAVLPFHPLDAQAGEALGLGLADAVITKSSNIRQLVVRPTSSIRQLRRTIRGPMGRRTRAGCGGAAGGPGADGRRPHPRYSSTGAGKGPEAIMGGNF
jgi:hypothetical protein